MKIKQIGNYNGDIIKTILENRNIEDVELFLHPKKQNELNSFNLYNMRQGAEVVLAHLLVNNNGAILVDPDADGFSSSSIIYQYIKKIKPDAKLNYLLHDTKAHGLTDKIIDKIVNSPEPFDYIIIPDAASNDEKAISKLYYMGMDVIVIDHHEVENVPKQGIIINNQLDSNMETNKNLVGAGMAYKFCQALDHILNTNFADDLLELVAIGQVGDSSDISENEVRYLVFQGIKNINNPFIQVVLADKLKNQENVAPKDLSFSIIPLINAVVRVGTDEEKDYLFRALNSINADDTFVVTKKKKNKQTGKFDSFEVEQNFYEYVYDICKRVKSRQDNLVKKTMAELLTNIDNSCGIAIGVLQNSDQGSITGLVANKLVSKFQKPVILVHHVPGKYVGSGRGYVKVLPSLKDWCNETKLVEFAQGHANAFGISIFEENFEAFKEKAKEVEKQEFVYEVDLLLEGKVDKKPILDVEDHKYLFGGRVHDPLFAFTGIKVRKEWIRQRGQTLTFFDSGVEFVFYHAPEGLFESLTHNFDQFITMDFVGKPSVNRYGNKITPQIILEDCERNEQKIEEKEITIADLVF